MKKDNIVDELRKLRKFKELTRLEFSKLSGLNENTIASIELKRCNPSLYSIEKMANALNCKLILREKQ